MPPPVAPSVAPSGGIPGQARQICSISPLTAGLTPEYCKTGASVNGVSLFQNASCGFTLPRVQFHPSPTYDFMKSPDPKIIVAADAKKPTETVAARAFSLAESNFWLRNLKIRDYEALFARTIEDTNHPHLFNHDTPLGTAPKSRKRSITSQKATIWPFFAIFPSENTFYLVPRGCGSIKGVPWNHLTISKT